MTPAGTDSNEVPGSASLTARQMGVLMAAWLVPGGGHFLLGRRQRAAIFFTVILASVIVGWQLGGNLYRILPNQPLTILATLGSMGMGAPYFVLRYFLGYQGNVIGSGYEYGSAFLLSAGLMNLLLILDTWDIVRGRKV